MSRNPWWGGHGAAAPYLRGVGRSPAGRRPGTADTVARVGTATRQPTPPPLSLPKRPEPPGAVTGNGDPHPVLTLYQYPVFTPVPVPGRG